MLKANDSIAVVNPMWNYKYHEIKNPNYDTFRKFHIGHGFSDQCYLIRTVEFRRRIYHYEHESGCFYPKYGGELFEKRCNAYMRCNNRLRATYLRTSYWTENINGLEDFQKRKRNVVRKIVHCLKIKCIK